MRSVRDEWGVPHIAADTETEAFRAVGYAQAEDNLPWILQLYTALQIQGAARYGSGWVPSDRAQLRWGHFAAAKRQLERLSSNDHALYQAYMDGIRAYMDEHPDEVTGPAPDLHPALPIATYRYFLWGYMIIDALEAASRGVTLDPQVLDGDATILSRRNSASNQWVILPKRTIEGVTVVLSDPHGGIAEFPMFEYRLRAGRFDFIGVATPGAMLPFLGHTTDVAWGATTGGPRVSDCYLLVTRADGSEYLHGDEWRPVTRRTVSLKVAGSESATVVLESVTLNDVESPVIGRSGDRIAVACTPYMAEDMPAMDETLLGWFSARNLEEWKRAAALTSMFQQNFVVGDRHGNAMYVRMGRAPRRADGVDPTRPIDGYNERTRWRGCHSFDELVQTGNPPCGYMHNNNEAPDAMFPGAADTSLAAGRYPSYLFNDTPGRTHDRGLAFEEGLENGKVSVDDVIALGLSDRWPTATRWRDALASAAGRIGSQWSNDEQAVLLELLDFTGECGPQSAGALAYFYWRTSMHLVCDPDAEAPPASVVPAVWDQIDAMRERYACSRALWFTVEAGEALTEDQQGWLVEAVRVATRRMLEEVGRIGAAFGDIFRIGRGARDWPARSAFFPAYAEDLVGLGDNVMPLRLMFAPARDPDGERRITAGGRSWRLTAFTDPIRSYSLVLYGQSGRPESQHYSDQCALYSEGRVRETGFATLLDAAESA
jgi:acyl-homoserine-lactone acylase